MIAKPSLLPEATFSNKEWQALLAFRVGASSPSASQVCAGCGKSSLKDLPDHVLACHSCGIYHRHNLVRDVLATHCRSAGWHTQLEVALPSDLAATPDLPQPLRPADIFVSNKGAHPLALDIGISHPLRPSAPPAQKAVAGESASAHEDAKFKKYTAPCKEAGWIYRPVCFEATGAWGPSALACVRQLSRTIANKTGDRPLDVFNGLAGSISIALAKGVGSMLVKGLSNRA